jgi:hypothetical protein
LLLQAQLAQDIGGAECVEGFADRTRAETFDHVRRRAQHQRAKHVGDGFEFLGKAVDPRRVALAEPGNGLMGTAFAGQQITPIGRGEEILRAALDNPQAMIGQP